MDSLTILIGVVLVLLVVLATTAEIARHSQFYRRELAATGSRELPLDGLRGLAALMVVTYHAGLCGNWLATGIWAEGRSVGLQLLGPGGVTLFFMLTGYLFWSKARSMNGKINPWKLWRGRLYRIAPLYLFSLLIMLLLAVIQTGGQWLALENWQPLLRLFALGALHWQPVGPVDFNAYNAGVVWTLWYEWSFYLLLPFIAWLAVGRKIFAAAPVFCFLIFACLWFNLNVEPALFFILGMLCPALLEDQTVRSQLRRPAAAILAVTITGLLCLACRSPLPKQMSFGSVEGALLPVFFVTAAGNTFGGFLTHPAVRCLGAMSFSLYLLHGIGLKLVFRLLQAHGLTDLTPPAYWLVITVTATVITLICSLTYRWIEFPFLSNSHKVSGRNTTAGQ